MPSSKWECSVCLVRNDESRSSCEACTVPRKQNESTSVSSSTSISTTLTAVKSTFGNQFKPKSDTWECPSCMIRNKNDASKCVACNSSKPGGEIKADNCIVPKLPSSIDAGFKNIVAQQTTKWECPACMTRNESSRMKCICCEQAKPGSVAASDSAPKFSFGASSASKFNFGFKTSAEQNESASKKGDSSIDSGKQQSETKGFTFGSNVCAPSSSTASAAGFSFGIKPVQNTPSSSIGKDVIDTSGGFKFGVETSTSSKPSQSSAAGFTFGTNKTLADDQKANSEIITTTSTNVPQTNEKEVTSSSAPAVSVFKPVAGFSFGSAPIANTASAGGDSKKVESQSAANISQTQKPSENKSMFASAAKTDVGSSLEPVKPTAPVFGSLSPAQKPSGSGFDATAPASVKGAPTGTSGFVFGKPTTALSTSATPLFGAKSSPNTFGSVSVQPAANLPGSTAGNSSLPQQASSTFGSTFGAPPSSSNTVQQQQSSIGTNSTSNLFSFGAAPPKKEVSATPIFGNATSSTNKTFSFGSKASDNAGSGSSSFVFGASNNNPKPAEPSSTNLFGSAPNASNSSVAVPTFGSFAAAANSSQQPAPTFGQPASNPNPFGASSLPSSFVPPTEPTSANLFGAAATVTSSGFGNATFGAANNSTFGSSSTAAPTFGSGFGTASSNTDVSAPKRAEPAFNFGAPTQQNTNPGFSFGSNNNNVTAKPAFNFSATGAPSSFNFTGSSDTTPNAPFQFNAAVPTNNIFAPTPTPGTPSAQQGRRKVRTAARRITPR